MIHGTPKIIGRAIELHIDFIDMLLPMRKATHAVHSLPPNVSREHRAKPVPPEPNRFMEDIDAALEQQVFHAPQAKWETHIRQNDKTDHLRRRVEIVKRISGLRSGPTAHLPTLITLNPPTPSF